VAPVAAPLGFDRHGSVCRCPEGVGGGLSGGCSGFMGFPFVIGLDRDDRSRGRSRRKWLMSDSISDLPAGLKDGQLEVGDRKSVAGMGLENERGRERSSSRPGPSYPEGALRRDRGSTRNEHLLLSYDNNPRFHGGCFGV
jgi:hypothetical protein